MIAHLKGREKALEAFGWTGKQAEWIALVCLHSGVFTRDQISDWLGIHDRTARRFIRDMLDQRLAAEGQACGPEGLPDLRACSLPGARGRGHPPPPDRLHRGAPAPPALARLRDRAHRTWRGCRPSPRRSARSRRSGIDRRVLPVRVYRGAAGDTRRYFPLKLPVALDTESAVFVYADPGHETAAGLHSWGRAHRELWRELRDRGLPVEAVAVVLGGSEFERAEKVLGNWTAPARSPGRSTGAATGRRIRREIDRIEQAIRGMDESVIQAYGSLRGCLARLVELRAALPTAPSEAMIDGFAVWRSPRLSGGLF